MMRNTERALLPPDLNDVDRQRIADLDSRYVIQPWVQSQSKAPRHVVEWGKGSRFRIDGREVIDFGSQAGYMSLGYGHPRIVEAMRRQLDVLPVAWSRNATEPRARLAERLAQLAPGSGQKVFFSTGGAEAVEAAIMAAREVTGRRKILTHYLDYHGATSGTIATSGDQRGWQPLNDPTSIVRIPSPYPYRCSICHGACNGSCFRHIEEIIRLEGPGTIAAILFEPIQGTNGVIVPYDAYLPQLRRLADRHGILLIADEVMTGLGRTGSWFACEHWAIVPDITVVAKGVNSGYVPLGATILSASVAEFYDKHPWRRGHSYTGHALAAAAALATIESIEDEGLVENARVLGDELLRQARELIASHPSIGEVRGKGLFVGIELVGNRQTRQPLYDWATGSGSQLKRRVLDAVLQNGVSLMEGNASALILVPPLNISREDIHIAIEAIDGALSIADAEVTA